jgi:hypothetical protein
LPFLIIPLRGILVTDLGVSTTPADMDESLHIIGDAGSFQCLPEPPLVVSRWLRRWQKAQLR